MRNYIDDAAINRVPSLGNRLSFCLLKYSFNAGVVVLIATVCVVTFIAAMVGLTVFLSPLWLSLWAIYELVRAL